MAFIPVGKVSVNTSCDRRRCKCWCHTRKLGYLLANERPHVAECAETHFPNAATRRERIHAGVR